MSPRLFSNRDFLQLRQFYNSRAFLAHILDGTLCKDGTIFAITTNHIEKLDPALYRKGRIDLSVNFLKCDHYQLNIIYKAIMNRFIPDNLFFYKKVINFRFYFLNFNDI